MKRYNYSEISSVASDIRFATARELITTREKNKKPPINIPHKAEIAPLRPEMIAATIRPMTFKRTPRIRHRTSIPSFLGAG